MLTAHLAKYGKVYDAPRAHYDRVRRELGLESYAIEGTLRETRQTLMTSALSSPL